MARNLLQLPTEILLNIAFHVDKKPRNLDSQRDLANLSLVCRRMGPIAQEVLFTAPLLRTTKINVFLIPLFQNQELQRRVKSLHFVSDTSEKTILSPPKGEILSQCVDVIETLPVERDEVERWISRLQTRYPISFEPALSIIFTKLPYLQAIDLGAAQGSDYAFETAIFQIFCKYRYGDYRCPGEPMWSPALPLFASRIKVLELDGLLLQVEDDEDTNLTAPLSHFTNLRRLMLPESAIGAGEVSLFLPPMLEDLSVYNVRYGLLDALVADITSSKKDHHPHLTSISMYTFPYKKEERPDSDPVIHEQLAKAAGIRYTETVHPEYSKGQTPWRWPKE